jgi:Leucine-rich repeat (LRR) protein
MEIQSASQKDKAVLGEGYNSEAELFVGTCIVGTEEFVGAQEASVTFSRSLTNKELQDSLGFSVGGKARYGVIDGSMSANYSLDSSSNSYCETTTYFSRYKFKNRRFRFTGLTPEGERACGNLPGGQVGDQWVLTCGHEFVEQITLGASLYISVRIEFTSREEKEKFSAKARIKGPAASLSAEISSNSQSASSTATISIQGYQLGGSVEKLSAIFGGSRSRVGDSGKEVHSLIACSMANPGPCLDVLDAAIMYATDTNNANAFPQQINPSNIGTISGPAELSYITRPYTDLAYYPADPIVAGEIRRARERLRDKFEENLEYFQRCRMLRSGVTFRMTARQSKVIDNVSEVIDGNLMIIQNAANICFTDLRGCSTAVQDAMSAVRQINPLDLDIQPESIAQWYDIKDLPSTKKSIKETMNCLEIYARANLNDFDQIQDKAKAVEDLVEHLQSIVIAAGKDDVVSFTPLTGLSNVSELTVIAGDYELDSLSALSSLQKLSLYRPNGLGFLLKDLSDLKLDKCTAMASLSLDGISCDLTPVGKLANLGQLDLAQGRFTGEDCLGNLQALVSLSISCSNISCMKFIESLLHLESLHIENCPFNGDFYYLRSLSCLQSLVIMSSIDALPSGIDALVGLGNLNAIKFENIFLDEGCLAKLSDIKSLRQLALINNQISSVRQLANMKGLNELAVEASCIKDIDSLASLPSIEILILHDCGIENLDFLVKMPRLRVLSIKRNKISNVSALSAEMTSLESLDLSHNVIVDCEPVSRLPHLKKLDIGSNQITDLRPLRVFEKIEYFAYWGNPIEYDIYGQRYIN